MCQCRLKKSRDGMSFSTKGSVTVSEHSLYINYNKGHGMMSAHLQKISLQLQFFCKMLKDGVSTSAAYHVTVCVSANAWSRDVSISAEDHVTSTVSTHLQFSDAAHVIVLVIISATHVTKL